MAEPDVVWFCYMVECSDRSFYVGIATDVEERVRRHNWGVGPEYTAKRRPVRLVWSERCESCNAARTGEKEVKGWSRKKKIELLAGKRGKPFAPKPGAQGKGESSNG